MLIIFQIKCHQLILFFITVQQITVQQIIIAKLRRGFDSGIELSL